MPAACELLLFLLLTPLLEADMRREWDSQVVACDASSVFGFVVSVADVDPHVARTIGS